MNDFGLNRQTWLFIASAWFAANMLETVIWELRHPDPPGPPT